jgi:hypothetical protein
VAGLFFAAVVLWRQPIAEGLGYGNNPLCIFYVAGILLLDSITAILFARLRYEHKALKFAVFKTIKICFELGFNLIFFLWASGFMQANRDRSWSVSTGSPGLQLRAVCHIPFLRGAYCSSFRSLIRNKRFSLDRNSGRLRIYSLP